MVSALEDARALVRALRAESGRFSADEIAAFDLMLEATAPPTDNERETLAQAGLDSERLRQIAEWLSMEHGHEETAKRVSLIADRHDRLAAGFRHHGAVTDTQVEAALDAFYGSDLRRGSHAPMRAALEAAALHRQGPITDEWEWGAIWTNGVVEGKWFDMGDSFAIREAAERQVDGYVDPQIVLGRRRKAGPWEPVEAARDAS